MTERGETRVARSGSSRRGSLAQLSLIFVVPGPDLKVHGPIGLVEAEDRVPVPFLGPVVGGAGLHERLVPYSVPEPLLPKGPPPACAILLILPVFSNGQLPLLSSPRHFPVWTYIAGPQDRVPERADHRSQ